MKLFSGKTALPQKLSLNPSRCLHNVFEGSNCQNCLESCHYDALSLDDQEITVSQSHCIKCGDCLSACPQEVFSLPLKTQLYNENSLVFCCPEYKLHIPRNRFKYFSECLCYKQLDILELLQLNALNFSLYFLYDENKCKNCKNFFPGDFGKVLSWSKKLWPNLKYHLYFININEFEMLSLKPLEKEADTERRHFFTHATNLSTSIGLRILGDKLKIAELREGRASSKKLPRFWNSLLKISYKTETVPSAPIPASILTTINCTLCGLCVRQCPQEALSFQRYPTKSFCWDPILCTYCNQCIEFCPEKALSWQDSLTGKDILEKPIYCIAK